MPFLLSKFSARRHFLLFCFLFETNFGPSFCGHDISSVVDNSIVGTPKVVCAENEVALDIITAKPFVGNIFVKGRAKDASCKQSFSDPPMKNSSSAYTLSLGKCGMQRLRSANPRGISFTVTVVVSFHPSGFITKNDRAFHLSCFYTEPDETVTSSFEVSQLPTQELSDHMHMPSCQYSVHSGALDGKDLSWANVGDTVFHVWECKGPEMGMLIKKCFVTDGDGEDHAVVNEDGCSLDHSLLSEVIYEKDSMRAYAKSQVFKYADSNQLFFTCQIRMCQKQMDMCNGVTPPKCGGEKKQLADEEGKKGHGKKRKGHHHKKGAEKKNLANLDTENEWSVENSVDAGGEGLLGLADDANATIVFISSTTTTFTVPSTTTTTTATTVAATTLKENTTTTTASTTSTTTSNSTSTPTKATTAAARKARKMEIAEEEEEDEEEEEEDDAQLIVEDWTLKQQKKKDKPTVFNRKSRRALTEEEARHMMEVDVASPQM